MLIELDQATVFRDGARVLHDVSLRIALGQHTVVLGPNGCGKSTLVQLIHRRLYPVAGTPERPPVKIFGQARWDVAALRSRLGVVSADLSSDLNRMHGLDVEDAVISGFWGSHGIPPHRTPTTAMREQTTITLERLGIAHLRHRRIATLSAGESRRVLIARAMVHRPEALLLDEPTTGLDFAARRDFLLRMRTLAQQGVTLVMVTHHLEEVLPETRQVILLGRGQVLAQGEPDAVLTPDNLSALYGLPVTVQQQADGSRHLLSL